MRDTTEQMLQKQRDIVSKMTEQKRCRLGMQMIQDVKTLAENSLRLEHPDSSLAQRKVLLLQRYYGHEMSPQDLEACSQRLLTYWEGR